MTEYEEAREKVAQLCCDNCSSTKSCDGGENGEWCEWQEKFIPEILSLKDKGWRLAIIKDSMIEVGKPNFKHVVWQVGDNDTRR